MLGGECIQYIVTKIKQQLKDKVFFALHVWHICHSSLLVRMDRENSCPVLKAPTDQTTASLHIPLNITDLKQSCSLIFISPSVRKSDMGKGTSSHICFDGQLKQENLQWSCIHTVEMGPELQVLVQVVQSRILLYNQLQTNTDKAGTGNSFSVLLTHHSQESVLSSSD